MGTSKLGNMLVEDGLLSETDRRTIKRTCGTGGSAFARGILAMGLLDEDELAAYIAEHTQWQVASKGLLENIQSGAWGCIDRPLVEHLEVLPLKLMGESLQVAMVDPLDQDTLSQLEFFTGYKIQPVIATMSQVRDGLQKVMPDFLPASSQLEDFLKNHSISASKRQRLEEQTGFSDLPAPEAFSVRESATARRSEPKFTPPAGADQIEFDEDDDVEMDFTEEKTTVAAAKKPQEAPISSDDDNLFTIEDDEFAVEPEDETETRPIKGAAAVDDSLGDDLGDDLSVDLSDDFSDANSSDSGGDITGDLNADLDVDLGGDDIFALEADGIMDDLQEAPKSVATKAPAKAAAPLPDDFDLGGDDLSAFDPDLEDGELDFGSDLEADLGASTPGASLEADLGSDLGSEITDDLSTEASDELESEIIGEADTDLELGVDLGADLTADVPQGTDDTMLDDTTDDGLTFDESGELTFDESGDLTFDEPALAQAALAQDLDVAAVSGLEDMNNAMPDITVSEAPEQISTAINKMLFAVTMSLQTKEAVSQIAPDLKAAGFSAGMVIGGDTKGGFYAECGWMETGGDQPAALSADAFKAKGIAAALGRLGSTWTALDDSVRQGDLKVFATLQRENRKLFGIRFQNPSNGSDTVIVTAMTDDISRNQGLMDMAADLFRQVARKDKAAA